MGIALISSSGDPRTVVPSCIKQYMGSCAAHSLLDEMCRIDYRELFYYQFVLLQRD